MARQKGIRRIAPASRDIRDAANLYEDFSGHEADVLARMPRPKFPAILVAVGECDGILYTTVRDGKREKYIHEFKPHAKPTLAATPDGSQLFLLGGAFTFTERGIVDDA